MKPVFKATALLSGSSVASILLSLASAKVLTSILGPSGYGYYGLLQSLVAVLSLVAGMGMATGIVRLGAGAAKDGDHAVVAKVRAGAWLLTALLGALMMAILAIFREPVSEWALGSRQHEGAILLMGMAIWFTVAFNVQNGILNAWHRVEAMATLGIANSALTAVVSIAAVVLWRADGAAPAVVGSAVATWVASRWLLWRNTPKSPERVTFAEAARAARSLLSFGLPFTASSAVGTGVQLALPMVVLHLLSTEAVAYYKAAAAISVGYLGFLVTAMGQDYYPRLSAVRNEPEKMVALIHDQYRLVMLLAGPMILGTLALVPYIVPLVYSRQFTPTIEILEWQLIGDLFKFSSWTMAFAVLARAKPSVYFCSESIGGALTLTTAWLGARMFGVAGLGIGFVLTYVVYYLVVRTLLRREIPMRESAGNLKLMAMALSAALIIRILPSTPLAGSRTIIALSLATALGLWNLRIVWREYIVGHAWGKAEALAAH